MIFCQLKIKSLLSNFNCRSLGTLTFQHLYTNVFEIWLKHLCCTQRPASFMSIPSLAKILLVPFSIGSFPQQCDGLHV